MLKKSLKWMIATLVIFSLVLAGVLFILHKDDPKSSASGQTSSDNVSVQATPVPTDTPEPTPTVDPATLDELEKLEYYVSQMTLDDRIGQLVMFGFSGQETPTEVFRKMISGYHIGNFVLYGSNIADTDEDGGFWRASVLTEKLNKLNKTEIPPLISIDIEGGTVVRFNWIHTPLSARRLGKLNDYDTAYQQFVTIGNTLKGIGINMNLAPVLDIAKYPMLTMFETRIISSSADVTAKIGKAIVAGLNDSNCLSTAKHFPGHGGTNEDSHDVTPVIEKTLEEMDAYDLIPFQECIEAGVDTVLVAHISYPNIDPDDIASMSDIFITDLLRNKYGHTGIIMSDDFRMMGLGSRYEIADAAVKFINAGGDLILCGPRHDIQKEILRGLENAVDDGTLTEERINESVVRILQKKMKVTDWKPFADTAE